MTENAFPIRPKPEEDARFSNGLAVDVKNALKRHGYPVDKMSAHDFLELKLALWRFLYEERQ